MPGLFYETIFNSVIFGIAYFSVGRLMKSPYDQIKLLREKEKIHIEQKKNLKEQLEYCEEKLEYCEEKLSQLKEHLN